MDVRNIDRYKYMDSGDHNFTSNVDAHTSSARTLKYSQI